MLVLLSFVLSVVAAVVLGCTFGWRLAVFCCALMFVAVLHYPLLRTASGSDLEHIGIADASPTIYPYSLLFLVVAALGLIAGRHLVGVWHYMLIVEILALTLLVWRSVDQDVIISGVLQFCTGIAGWATGRLIGAELWRSRMQLRAIAIGVLAVTTVELVLCFMQLANVGFLNQIVHGRAQGSFGNPATFGKFLFLLLVVVLPLTRQGDRMVRLAAHLTVLFSIVAIGLTQERANFIAYLLAVLAWSFFPAKFIRQDRRPTIYVAVISVIVAAPFYIVVRDRFIDDPYGGSRPELLAAAMRQIDRSFLVGTGPNNYVATVGIYDPAATGVPVHNTFLLALGEIGIFGAIALFTPLVLVVVRAIRFRRAGDDRGLFARALLACTPGMLLICATGYGMLAGEILPFWFFILGLAASRIRAEAGSGSGEAVGLDENLPPSSFKRHPTRVVG